MRVRSKDAPSSAQRTESRKKRKALVAGSVGNTVEWIDWALYSALAPIFATQFFPPSAPGSGLLAILAVFAVGFVMRPVGGAVIGVFTDRHGRKKGLTLTIVMMAGCAFVIALCPTYDQIGVAAPIVLLLARLVQGFSAGGEFGSSSALLVESATGMRRAFAGSWQQVSAGLGVLIAAVLALILTSTLDPEVMSAWGWRAAFIAGGLLGLVGLWLRIGLEETDGFRNAQADGRIPRNPMTEMLRKHPGAAFRVIGMAAAGVLIYYIWINYMPGYVSAALGTMSLQTALLANTIALAYFLCLLPFAGIIADRVGRKPVMLTFAIGFLLFAYPAFRMLETGGFWTLLAVEIVGVTLLAGYAGLIATVMAEQFPAEVRTTGIGFPYAIAVALFGGTAPYITTWLATNGLQDWVWLYVAAAALVGVVVYARMPETRDRVLA
ncbi:MFS transporter [Rhodococcus sp. T7]|uniref:MFS transporter n=1 Tax=Rhodococcus sp. T7 TaxID=627444 RepID=UPI001357BE48|nr:MFS transporter [Rhodococcus sp. T7]KAF0960401.1 Proline/betaine transporter [Rhodococcus sp. T7]